MPITCSILLIFSLVFAVTLGPNNSSWSWGPSLLCLAAATACTIPSLWRRKSTPNDSGVIIVGALCAAWFAGRAWFSPVHDLSQSDLFLLVGAVCSFICVRSIGGNPLAEKVLTWGIALLLLASVIVIAFQVSDPNYRPFYRPNPEKPMVSGFFTHYNYGANFLIGASMLVLAAGFFSRYSWREKTAFIIIGIAGITAVYFTHSRGGLLSVIVAIGIFSTMLLIHGHRNKAKWFAVAVITIPLLAVGLGIALFFGWQHIQSIRSTSHGLDAVMDNNARLYFLGIALSCMGLHPWIGGGSRSFSWECFGFADAKAQGDTIVTSPEMVHNEWMQSATEYGLIGAFLITVLIGSIILGALIRMLFHSPSKSHTGSYDVWQIGAMAALIAILVHSCFSFVFHLIPGALLLGIILGMLNYRTQEAHTVAKVRSNIIIGIAAIVSIIFIIPPAWQSCHTLYALKDIYFKTTPNPPSNEFKINALAKALATWPDYKLYSDRGILWHELAVSGDAEDFMERVQYAIDDYKTAEFRHPYQPQAVINQAILLSTLRKDTEAEEKFRLAIDLQGGMEPAFRSHFQFYRHLQNKGLLQLTNGSIEAAQDSIELALKEFNAAIKMMHWMTEDLYRANVDVCVTRGMVQEAKNDFTLALESYNYVSHLTYGQVGHYHASRILEKRGNLSWYQRRPQIALRDFIDARNRIAQAGDQRPPNITLEQHLEAIARVDASIKLLKDAGITSAQ